ncbi:MULTISPECIES: phosphatase domain-containing putative toxin [Xanthomonas]|uniref:phosphatase domain-containing putative toxin n=1 Tax=Xanthomonas cannabis TaxID=1885674 RepID=UPI00068CCF1A|nr:sulfur transferase domain-containing protein [Xanthomonas cannabis]MCC4612358.1 hypothetical protein [Xanthomonas campestris pv. esculenti]MCC8442162.1 hypothetical protein [Xanthomonas cannabis]
MTTPILFAKGHYASGQPTQFELAELARKGVRTVINLRAPEEPVDYDEAMEADRLGLRYASLPIADASDLDPTRIRAFGRMLDQARLEGDVLIHCASSNRVGAMVTLDQVFNRGTALAAALEGGRAAGLKTLEPAVIALAQTQVRSADPRCE